MIFLISAIAQKSMRSLQEFKRFALFDNSFDSQIAYLLCVDKLPISLVTKSPVLRMLLQTVHGTTIPVKPDTLFASVVRFHTRVVAKIKSDLKGKPVSICADE